MTINQKLIKVNYSPTRFGDHVRLIVLHTESGWENGTTSWFNNPAAHASAHYGIGLDGQVDQYVSEGDTAWHAGVWNVNTGSVGIEHEDDDNPDHVARTDAQYDASAHLVADICRRFGLSCDRTTVKKHNEVSNSHPDCPGDLDVDHIVALAQAILGAKASATVVSAFSVPGITPVSETATITVDTLNVRQGPGTTYAGNAANTPDGQVHAGTNVTIVGYVIGESVQGNPYWLQTLNNLHESHWIWAGGTNIVIPSTSLGTDPAPAPTPVPNPEPTAVPSPEVAQPEITPPPEPVTNLPSEPQTDAVTEGVSTAQDKPPAPIIKPVTGTATLATDGYVYNLATNEAVAMVPSGTVITVAGTTIHDSAVYLVTQKMLDEGLNEGIPSTYFVRRVDSVGAKPAPVTLAQVPKGWHPVLKLLAWLHKIKL